MPRSSVLSGAAALLTVLLSATGPAAAGAAPSSRSYTASLTGTQESTWEVDESGTCTGDDFVEHPFTGSGSGKASLSFRTKKSSTVVAFRQGKSARWGFNYQASPVVASGRPTSPYVEGTRTGTHSTNCPNNQTLTRTDETSGCGERRYQLDLKAFLNLPSRGKPGQLTLEGLESGPGTGAKWGDDCPYFVGLQPFEAHGNEDQPFHIPGGGLLTVRKNVGSDALRRGKALTITGKRTMPYDQTRTDGEITTHVRGETTVRWTLRLTPKR